MAGPGMVATRRSTSVDPDPMCLADWGLSEILCVGHPVEVTG